MSLKPPIGNKKSVVIAVAIMISVFALWRCSPANADEGVMDVGATYTGGFNGGTAFSYSERLAGKWDIGVKVISEQSWEGNHARNNGGIFGQRIVKSPGGRFELGVGFAYFIGTSPLIGCHGAFELSARYNITPKITLTYRHNSNGSICDQNRGQDVLSIGWRFGG